MTPTGLNTVALGRADTGKAFVLPDAYDPLREAQAKGAEVRAGQEAKAKKQQLAQEEKQKALADLNVKMKTPYKGHLDYFNKRRESIIQMGQGLLGSGVNLRDYSNPSAQAFHQAQQKLLTDAEASSNQIKFIQDMNKKVADNSDQFTPDAVRAWTDYTNLPFEQMMSTPPPQMDQHWDKQGYIKQVLENYANANVMGTVGMGKDGNYYTTVTKELTPDKLQDAAPSALENPFYKARIEAEWKALPDSEKARYRSLGIQENQRRDQEGKGPLSVAAIYAWEKDLLPAQFKEKKTTLQQQSAASRKAREEEITGKWLVNQLKGLASGDFAGYTDIRMDMGAGQETSMQASNVLKGRLIGGTRVITKDGDVTYQDKEEVNKVYRDPKTGLVAYTTNLSGEPKGPNDLEWMQPEELFSTLGTKITEHSKELKLAPQLEYLSRHGIDVVEGDVDLESGTLPSGAPRKPVSNYGQVSRQSGGWRPSSGGSQSPTKWRPGQ